MSRVLLTCEDIPSVRSTLSSRFHYNDISWGPNPAMPASTSYPPPELFGSLGLYPEVTKSLHTLSCELKPYATAFCLERRLTMNEHELP